jgi:TrmH family RNA methyltransferase
MGLHQMTRGKWRALLLSTLLLPRIPTGLTLRLGVSRHFSHGQSSEEDGPIMSASNAKVKLMKSLKLRKYREKHDLVLFEGHRQILGAVEGGQFPTCVLYDANNAVLSPMWERLQKSLSQCQVLYPTNSVVMNEITDTVNSQGVVASFPKPSTKSLMQSMAAKADAASVYLLLDRPADPGNVGSLIRSALGFGLAGVIVAEGVDVWSPKVIRYINC